jgi:hypothetical protein
MGEKLYNGIRLPAEWPPKYSLEDLAAVNTYPPYLRNPPAVIPIDTGRQLFVDDFLIAQTDCVRVFVKPEIHPASPVLKPETLEELDNGNCAMAAPFNDGCWYDPEDRLFKMWYMPGWFHTMALALSDDGIHWKRPDLGVVSGTNLVWPPKEFHERDGSLVWLDCDSADPTARFKAFQFYRYGAGYAGEPGEGRLQASPDGIHWSDPVITTPVGDNSSFFYNPFRKKWVMSIRRAVQVKREGVPEWGLRARYYHESEDFIKGARWAPSEEVLWQETDSLDLPDPRFPNHNVALYDLNASPYESLMIGLFGVFRGPENNICEELGIPKTIDLEAGYSRDGFHFTRPDRTPFLASSRKEGDWNRAYLHSTGGLCLVVEDKLYFYFTGFSGESEKLGRFGQGYPGRSRRVMYAGASTGLAVLRRDGFVAMTGGDNGRGTLLTRPVLFSGKYLFVNADCGYGDILAEVLGPDQKPIEGYGKEQCEPVQGDSTKACVAWKGKKNLSDLAGKPVSFRFYLNNSRLYAFWVSLDEKGRSGGYVAAGGPGLPGARDL